jgi:predicted transcriptional regulator
VQRQQRSKSEKVSDILRSIYNRTGAKISQILYEVNEAIVMINSDKQKSIVTWLETNDTKTIYAPMIMA